MNIEITSSNACRNARILSIEIIFLLMKSGKLVDFIKRKKIGVSGTLNQNKFPSDCMVCGRHGTVSQGLFKYTVPLRLTFNIIIMSVIILLVCYSILG